MQKILEGVKKFQKTVFPEQRAFFEMLGKKQQTPIALFITCSDSRIDPNLLTSTEPGDLFIIRNAGNIVPPYGLSTGGVSATIEYAVSVLKVQNVIVCGHYHCGAMQALMKLDREKLEDMPAVRNWFAYAEATRRIVRVRHETLTEAEQIDLAIQTNVLVQIDHLKTHPSVAAAMARGELNVYGWVYRIETGEFTTYDANQSKFCSMSELETLSPCPMTQPLVCSESET